MSRCESARAGRARWSAGELCCRRRSGHGRLILERAGVVAHICARVSDGVYGVGMIDEREDADKAMS